MYSVPTLVSMVSLLSKKGDPGNKVAGYLASSCILILIDTGSPGTRHTVCLTMSFINAGVLINLAP